MRKKFLSQWSPYPSTHSLPSDCVFGQLILLAEDKLELQLQISSKLNAFKLSKKIRLQGYSPFEVLNPGDKIALCLNSQQEVEKLWLLAPNLKQSYNAISNSIVNWYKFQQNVRAFFLNSQFIETPTPSLVQNPGMEPHLHAFQTQWSFGEKTKAFFLPTSPEIHLKKLLSQGLQNIFEIKSCFRNEESSPIHMPEFTMLEWYRAYSGLEAIETDIQNLLSKLVGKPIELKKFHLKEFYEAYFKADWSEIYDYQALKDRAHKEGFSSSSMTWNDLFSWFQVTVVEPELKNIDQPVLLYGFPDLQPSLARSYNGESERFELYWKGVELANAYHELNDPTVQRQRWLDDLKVRQAQGLQIYELDEEFLEALEQGMPPSSGIALGLERLYMVINDIENIDRLSPFKN
ncbi:MAG: EF-P lysine aminoacylase GenX [Bdellovibrionales bacterium]|nr:EF-P lysine aminoacylase GenX [Bdellovibrionales bacterium]